MIKSREEILEVLKKVNIFLNEWDKEPVPYIKHIDYDWEDHEIFFIKRDITNVLTLSLGRSETLLKEAKNFNYQKSPVQKKFFYESQFQYEYHFFLQENGFAASELPDLSTTYIKVITYLKRAKRYQDVISVCNEALQSNACEKYMDYSKEITLAKSRLKKQQK